MADPGTNAAIEAVWRIEQARVVAALTRIVRSLELAEELAQDALVAALEHWPTAGIPDNPAAWLMATARHRAIDRLRRDRALRERAVELRRAHEQRERDEPDVAALAEDAAFHGDDVLRLAFMTCHPLLSTDARVALTLRLLGGLSTDEIARAFLVPEPTVAQRIVRARRRLADANVEFEVPVGDALAERLASVLEVVYLVFNEGYAATSGEDWIRPGLCQDALRMGRVLAELAPREREVHGLVALMELQASRLAARVDASGQPVLLRDQDRARWDHLLIRRGVAALARAESLDVPAGSYELQARIAACHAVAGAVDRTDWAHICELYAELVRIVPSPVVELNRAVAVSMVQGPVAALELVDRLVEGGRLDAYHLLPAVRGDLLQRLERYDEAHAAFERAAAMTRNAGEREVLLDRAAQCVRWRPEPGRT